MVQRGLQYRVLVDIHRVALSCNLQGLLVLGTRLKTGRIVEGLIESWRTRRAVARRLSPRVDITTSVSDSAYAVLLSTAIISIIPDPFEVDLWTRTARNVQAVVAVRPAAAALRGLDPPSPQYYNSVSQSLRAAHT